MGTVAALAREIERGLRQIHPGLRKTIVKKRAPTIAAAIQTQTANTAQWAAVLPIETERADMRLQWIARLLANPLLDSRVIIEPLARHQLGEAARHGQIVVLSLDQTDLGDRFAILSDFKTRGFGLEDTQLRYADRVDHLVLILSLAMHWCTDTGRRDASESPTPLEQQAAQQTDPDHWIFRKLARSCLSWFQRGLRKLLRFAELGRPLPGFAPSG